LINLVIVHYLSTSQINDFGWRIPFIIGGLLCFIAYRVRRELHESAAFKSVKKHESIPFAELLQHHLPKVLIGVGLVSIMATPIILLIIFMPTYLTKIVKLPPTVVSDAVLVAAIISVVSIFIMGILANRYDVIKFAKGSLLLIVLASIVCYYLIGNGGNLIIALSLFAVFQGFLVTLSPILLSYLFPIEVRLTGVALSYNISFVIFGGITPVVVTSLIEKTGLVYTVPVFVLGVTAVFAYWAVLRCQKLIKI